MNIRRSLPRGHAMTLVAEFSDRAEGAADLGALGALVEAVARDLGFRHFALVHHGGAISGRAARLFLQNYPEIWVERFEARALHRLDPVQRVASVRFGGFGWSRLPRLVNLSPAQQAMLGDSRRAGLGEGYTVPLHAPACPPASCSFVTGPGEPLPRRILLAADCVARSAFAVAARLLGAAVPATRLTPRQCDCVALMAQGKTDWEIGRILGLSEESVTKYLNAARRRFGVARRTQLALAALAAGEIALADIATWQ